MMGWHAISKSLVERSGIDWTDNEKEKDLCVYAFELLLSNIFNFILVISLCIFFNIQKECIIFLLFYCPVRFFAGGGHAPNHLSCIVIFYLYMHGSIILSNWLLKEFYAVYLLPLAGILLLLCLCLNIKYAAFHKAKLQKARHRKITGVLFLIEIIVMLLCLSQGYYLPIFLAVFGFVLESVMLLPFIYKPPVYQAESIGI